MNKEQLFEVTPIYESPWMKCTQVRTRRILCESPLEANSADPNWDKDSEDVNDYGDL